MQTFRYKGVLGVFGEIGLNRQEIAVGQLGLECKGRFIIPKNIRITKKIRWEFRFLLELPLTGVKIDRNRHT